jgi:hypothetical protein
MEANLIDDNLTLTVDEQCSSIEHTFQVLDGMLIGSDSTAELQRHIKDLYLQFSQIHERLGRL